MTQIDDPTEIFKQAVTATMRAISGNDELTVSFGRGKPYLQGNRARVPLPEAGLTSDQLAALRGTSDRFALRVRFHDEAWHRGHRPQAGIAQEVFDSVEDARLASIGSYLMKGVGNNLNAQLEQHCQNQGFDKIENQSQAPLGEAVGMMIRERLTGIPLPPSAEKVAAQWREYIDEHIGTDMEDLHNCMFDQAEFARRVRRIIADLGLSDEWGEEGGEGDAEEEQQSEEMESEAGDEASQDEASGDADMTDAIEGEVPVDVDAMDMAEAEGDQDEAGAPPDG
ncbi:MAG TPA: hypothetical protein VJ998_07415, partial [Pseudomonadales bacterium]|nr:hypothetical protein [Pseudomonadales bacterium]